MMTIKHILVPTDFSPTACHALDEAVALARTFGASITLLHVYGLPTSLPGSELAYTADVIDTLEQRARHDLDDERARVRNGDGPPIEAKVILGFAPSEILREAKRGQADLIVIGTHGRTGFRHLVLGSVAERVVREAPVPVLTLHLPPAAAASASV